MQSPKGGHRTCLGARLLPRLFDLSEAALVEAEQGVESRELLLVSAHLGAPRLAEFADGARGPAQLGGEDGRVKLLPQLPLVRYRVDAPPAEQPAASMRPDAIFSYLVT